MKLTFSAFLFLVSFFAAGQTIQYFDQDGKKVTDKSLARRYTETTTSDSLEATLKTYSADGTLESEENYSDLRKKVLNGVQKSWFADGKLKSESFYKKGKLEGIYKTYYKNGQLKRNDLYKNNKLLKGQCFSTTGSDTTYFAYAINPQFPGGEKAMLNFLATNIKYPEEAQKKKIGGKVILHFVINEDGKLSDVKFLKKAYPDLNREALRVINLMPDWQPGIQDGEKVKVKYTLPFNFDI